jgi:hypothetical protein
LRIEWHRTARADFAELIEDIAVDNFDAVYGVHDEVKTQAEILRRIRKQVVQVEWQAPVSWW